jgi:hypothetical protein
MRFVACEGLVGRGAIARCRRHLHVAVSSVHGPFSSVCCAVDVEPDVTPEPNLFRWQANLLCQFRHRIVRWLGMTVPLLRERGTSVTTGNATFLTGIRRDLVGNGNLWIITCLEYLWMNLTMIIHFADEVVASKGIRLRCSNVVRRYICEKYSLFINRND